jgi:hypothetical protein
MAKGDAPDYIVKLPVEGVWHRLPWEELHRELLAIVNER